MEVKPGYRQTAVGIIPDEWEPISTADIVDPHAPICYGVVQVGQDTNGGVPIVAIKYVKDIARAPLHRTALALEQPYTRSRVRGGDVLISIKGTIGRVGVVPTGFEGNVSRELARLRPREGYSANYIAQQLEADETQARIIRAIVGTTRLEFSIAALRKFEIPVPNSLDEQRAIADALSDMDALLGGLDRLIAKKRDLKQAAMQQLLTGQTRLPGFHGEWKSGNLASVIGALDAGVSVNSVEDDDIDGFDGMFILKTSAVAGGRFIPRECKRIALRDLPRASLNPLKGTIIISRMNTPDLVGECGFVDRDYPNLFVPDRLWMTRFKQDVQLSGLWLTYLLSTAALKRQIGAAATGTSGSMKNLSKHAFLQLPIALPPGPEQTAIEAVLSDMDAELSALEARRDKTRALKQAMMQELLTGKTRLVSTGGAHV